MNFGLNTDQINQFIDSQLHDWPMAIDGYAALNNVQTKTLIIGDMPVKVQFNPARMISTASKTDKDSILKRACFLCASYRPHLQKYIAWRGYELLVNPYPIFPRHLTIASRDHLTQSIDGRIGDMIQLALALKGFTIFYNGSRCGASAPDHVHFQAGDFSCLPLGSWIESSVLTNVWSSTAAQIYSSLSTPVKFFVIDAADAISGEQAFKRLVKSMQVSGCEKEPMMNILSYSLSVGVRVVVIPRKRHRPSFYGVEGEKAMLISPGAVDMAGMIITPREQDFDRLDSNIVREIYSEVSLNNHDINQISSHV